MRGVLGVNCYADSNKIGPVEIGSKLKELFVIYLDFTSIN